MDTISRKPRRIETPRERSLRLDAEAQKVLDRALSEEDHVDAMVQRSIRLHGA